MLARHSTGTDERLADYRARWSRLSLLSRVLLVLSVLSSAAVAAILGLVVYLFIGGYSGGSNPTSVAPLAFPLAILLFVIVALPSMLICGLLWAGFSLSSRRRDNGRTRRADRQPGGRG